jgi:hypothetical protein
MKELIVGAWEFCKMAGWRGVLCEIFNIDSKHNEMYQHAYKEGIGPIYAKDGPMTLDGIILHLACCIPDIEPFRTRAICQIRGFVDAKKERSKETT